MLFICLRINSMVDNCLIITSRTQVDFIAETKAPVGSRGISVGSRGNSLGTQWELGGGMVGTWWELIGS